MLKTLFLSILIAILFTCCYTNKNIAGKYSYSSKEIYAKQVLDLSTDSTFSYSIYASLINANSKGTWKLSSNNDIILSSDSLYRTGIMHVAEKHDSTLDAGSYSIHVFDEEKIPFGYSTVVFDNDTLQFCFLDEEGFCSISLESFSSLSIIRLSEGYHYEPRDLEANVFEITVKPGDLSSFYLENVVWQYKRGRVVNPDKLVFKKESN